MSAKRQLLLDYNQESCTSVSRKKRTVVVRVSQKLFSNELIMEKIGQALLAKHLVALRPTCTAWNQAFVPIIKTTHTPINLHGVGPLSDYTQFIRLRQPITDVPFNRYRIKADGDPEQWETTFEGFLEVVGCSITHLDLHWKQDQDFTVADLKRFIFEHLSRLTILCLRPSASCPIWADETQGHEPNRSSISAPRPLPNLKRLKVTTCGNHMNVLPAFGQLIADVINNAIGGLEYISIQLGPGLPARNVVTPIMSAFQSNSFQLHVDKLKTLKLSRVKTEELRSLVHFKHLRLETLSMVVVISQTCRTSSDERRELTSLFYELLLGQAPTLRKLGLEFFNMEPNQARELNTLMGQLRKFGSFFEVPRMERVRHLKLFRSEKMRTKLEFDGPRTFPNLKTLTYHHFEQQGVAQPLEVNLLGDLLLLSHPGITDLRVSASLENFTRFNSSAFPSVASFQLNLTSARFDTAISDTQKLSRVWTLWPTTLKSLHIRTMFRKFHRGTLTLDDPPISGRLITLDLDLILSGVGSAAVASHLRFGLEPPISLDTLRNLSEKHKFLPSILDMRLLEELTIETQVLVSTRAGLTEVGIYLGLALAYPPLKKVDISGANDMENRVSDACHMFLRSVLGANAVINI